MGCPSGKTEFKSPGSAQKGLRSVQRSTRKKRQHGRIPIRFYRCESCGNWHLTSEPKNGKRAA